LTLEENRNLVNELLDDLIISPFLAITLNKLQNQKPHLAERIKDISRQYREDLSMMLSPEEILKTILLETNHSIVIRKEQGVEVSERMHMLKEAYQHAKALEGKHVVLFVGDTGSGKSTSVAYYQGAKTVSTENAVKDRVVTIAGDVTRSPKIGQSLGESETVYTKGFPIINQDKLDKFDPLLVLADGPGFCDTRGEDYEIVTNMSLDCAVRSAEELRAIVVTIPIHTFLDAKVNHVIELIDRVRERFPFAFTKAAANRHVFLVITKQIQSQPGIVQSLKEEETLRFRRYLNEAIAARRKEMDKLHESGVNRYYLESLEKRIDIWKTLISMHRNGQVEVIDTKDQEDRRNFLEKLSKLRGGIDRRIDQGEYIPAMLTPMMQKKYGDDLELAAGTWRTSMLTPYLETIPAELSKIEKLIAEQTIEINLCEAQQIEIEDDLAKKKSSKAEVGLLINGYGALEILQPDVQEKINGLIAARMETLKKGLDRFIEREMLLNQTIADKQEELATQRKSRETRAIEKSRLEEEVLRASEGVYTNTLWKDDHRGKENEAMSVADSVSEEAWIKYFKDEISFEEATGTRHERIRKDYRGDTLVVAKIEKNYQIIPSDPAMQDLFASCIRDVRKWSSSDYIAELDGRHFSIEQGVHIMMEGRKINYGFRVHWDGSGMPWITITHTTPNVVYNAAAILNYREQIGIQAAFIEAIDNDILRIEVDITTKQVDIEAIETEKAKREMELRNLATSQALEDLQQSMQEEITDLERGLEALPAKITIAVLAKESSEKALKEQKKLKRNLALIIHTEKESGYQLKEFVQEVLQGKQEKNDEPSMINTCRRFLETFVKAEEDRVFETCARELGLNLEEQPTTMQVAESGPPMAAQTVVSRKGKEAM